MKKIIMLLFVILMAFSGYAQLNWFAQTGTTTAVADLNICDDATYSIYCINPTANTLTSPSLDIQLPASVQYIPGSLQLEAGSVVVTEGNIADLSHPVFTVANIPANGFMVFTYRVKSMCGGAANSVPVPITLTYDGNQTSSPNLQGAGLSAVNINSPAINIVAATNNNYTGNVGTSYTQTITLRNAGLGHMRLNRAGADNFVRVLLDNTACLSVSNPSVGTLSGDTLMLPLGALSGLLTGDADQLWENNEDLIITYNVNINCCAELTRGMTPQWGCDAATCNTGSTFTSNVIINNVTPNIAVAFPNVVRASYCMQGEVVTERLRVVNTGLGSATNISIVISNLIPGSIAGQNEFDTSGAWVIYDKNNNPIGNVTKVGSMAGGSDASSNCHGGQSYPAVVTLALASLAPNDTVYIDVKIKAPNLSAAGGCYNCAVHGVYALNRNSIAYQNACGTANYSVSTSGLVSFGPNIEYGASMEMPTDLQDGQVFEATYSNSEHHHRTKNAANGRAYYYIIVPPGFTVNGDAYKTYTATSTYAIGTMHTLTPFQIGDTIFVPFNSNADETGAFNLKVSITASCAFGGGSKTFNYGTRVYWDTLCANPTFVTIGCGTATTVLHCGNCPHGGATPVAYNLERVSYGLGDTDNNQYPDGVLDTALIAKHHALPGDTLKSTWNINVGLSASGVAADGGLPFPHVYVDAWFPTIAGDTILSINGATAYVYNRATGVLVNTCSGINPVTVAGTGNTEAYRYDLSNCKGSLWTNNDSIVFEAFHYIKAIQVYNSSAFRDDLVTSHHVFASYTPNPGTTYGDIYSAANPTGTKFTCDAYNNYMKIYNLHVSPYIPVGQVLNGCGGDMQYHLRLYTEIQSQETRFPNEYRWSAVPDSVRILIPQGLTPDLNNVRVAHNFTAPNSPTITLAPANVSIAGPYLILKGIRNYYVPFGGAIPLNEVYQNVIYVNYQPTCNAISDLPLASSAAFYMAGNPAHYPVPFASWTNNTYAIDSQVTSLIYKGPQPLMVGGGIVNITSDSVTWNLTRQNLSNTVDANNSWIYLTILQGTPLTNLTVKQGAAVIAPDANGFYQLGTNLKSSSVDYTVNGDAANCDTVKYLVRSGWGCSGYPVSINTPNLCFETDTLVAIPLPAGTDANLTVINNNGNTSNFCTPVEVEMTLNSTQLGDISNLTLDYILPFGFSYVPNSAVIQYPINTPYRVPSNPGAITFNQSIMNMDINNIDTTLGSGLTGSYDANLKTMKIKMQLMTECGAASGDVLSAVYNSLSACGEVLPVIVKESNPIIFTEAAVPGYTTTPSAIADTIDGCNAATLYDLDVFIDINQITGPSQTGDSIFVTLPPGVAFNNYDFLAPGQQFQPITAAPSGPVDVGNGQMRYGWPMTGGLPSGTIHFRFQYTFDYAQYTSCNQLLKSFIVTTGGSTQVACGGQTCNLFSINGRGDASMNIKMPSLQGSIQTTNCTYFPASSSTVSNPLDILITNTGNADVAAGTVTRVDIYCDADSNGVINAGDNVLQQATTTSAIPAGGSTTIGGIVISYSDFTCLSKKVLVNISRVPAVGAEQCVCEQPATNFVCIATPLPVILTSFTGIPQEVSNRLEWSVSKELNFSHYELERSTGTQTNFKRIASIEGRNALVSTSYHYDDLNPSLHEYYRLKMVDLDGKFAYSETVYLNREHITSENIYIYPNPVTNTLNLTYYGTVSEETLELNIVDMVGKLIMSKNVNVIKGINTLQLDTEDLASGNYILRIKRSERDMDEFIRFSK